MQFIANGKKYFLKDWEKSDSKRLFELADASILEECGIKAYENENDCLYAIENVFKKDYCKAICDEAGKVIGYVSLSDELCIEKEEDELNYTILEIKIWLAKEYQKQGIGTNALKCMIDYAFENLHADSIYFSHYDGNVPAVKIQEDLMFRPKKGIKNYHVKELDKTTTLYVSNLDKYDYTRYKKLGLI